ncbi:helix-turn-helix transcriptional regulator [Vibrio sp. MarTm2]|uniref:helix-turn-helix domain-containing protein n=1 Tax=Vibrio sp. MarTm2 TaxID=2998831 RepID=UPI0022CD6214|nr:helix-turn-helix transcriptional regulator [Vibrio sp. MarTm2]MDA0130681.1 helix-turn-helix transcriptional regulator [Vibrio sp. MarTm2]
MEKIKLSNLTTWSSVCSSLIRELRVYGPEFVLHGRDVEKIFSDCTYSQHLVAQELHMTKAAYSKIENADVVVNIFHISAICKIFSISAVDFMSAVESKVKDLEKAGIEVESSKLPFRLDIIRYSAKLQERTSAIYNNKVRELKKNKTFSMYSDEQLAELKEECKQLAYQELEEKQSFECALKEYEDSIETNKKKPSTGKSAVQFFRIDSSRK